MNVLYAFLCISNGISSLFIDFNYSTKQINTSDDQMKISYTNWRNIIFMWGLLIHIIIKFELETWKPRAKTHIHVKCVDQHFLRVGIWKATWELTQVRNRIHVKYVDQYFLGENIWKNTWEHTLVRCVD